MSTSTSNFFLWLLTSIHFTLSIFLNALLNEWEGFRLKTDDISIYNCCSGNLNTVTIGEVVEIGREIAKEYPMEGMLWHVGGSITTSPTIHYIKVLFLHLLPAILVDTILRALGKKPMLVKIQRRIYTANLALLYYITQQWTFDNKNLIALRSSIKEQDKKQFFYDIENVDKNEFYLNGILGGKKYLLKEKEENFPKAKAHAKRMWILHEVVQFWFYAFLAWWVINMDWLKNVAYGLAAML